ncbi:survival protein sure-like phosphatase/nucleotidase [Panus rudis PR-1116 ss-1]|nr:survival protein sure-like phosphatase/nucleotidase [Panus rudis PR-1116 ss-1]
MYSRILSLLVQALLFSATQAQKIVLTNDDGWATAQIRAQFNSLVAAGYDVIVASPAEGKSGVGSATTHPTALSQPCQFNTCPIGSPAEGWNASDLRLNWINGFPVDAVSVGIETLMPRIFGSLPDLVISGPNIGSTYSYSNFDGSARGAASEAGTEGIGFPAVAISGQFGGQVSYTTLDTDPTAGSSIAARVYSELTTTFANALLKSPTRPLMPQHVAVNINYNTINSGCQEVTNFRWVATRLEPNPTATDATLCGTTHLPPEATVMAMRGCWATMSIFDPRTKRDVSNATMQQVVFDRLVQGGLPLFCVTSS